MAEHLLAEELVQILHRQKARAVLESLQNDGPMSSTELEEKVGCSIRTVRYVLADLVEKDLVSAQPVLGDMRRRKYSLNVELERIRERVRMMGPSL